MTDFMVRTLGNILLGCLILLICSLTAFVMLVFYTAAMGMV